MISWPEEIDHFIQSKTFDIIISLAILPEQKEGAQSNGLLAFADPAFGSMDVFYSLRNLTLQSDSPNEQSISFPRLPETTDEVNSIAQQGHFVPFMLYQGREATEGSYFGSDTSPYSLIYFATHGVKADEIPGLHQPALVLAAREEAKEDGLLTLGEILETQLDGQTVILSACNTASAKANSFEPYSGLVRAFLYAGAKEVLASRWAVDSYATVELMTQAFAVIR